MVGVNQSYKIQYTWLHLSDMNVSPTLKVILYYNMAFCYQRLELHDDCIEHLELATHALKIRLKLLEDDEKYFKAQQRPNFDTTD